MMTMMTGGDHSESEGTVIFVLHTVLLENVYRYPIHFYFAGYCSGGLGVGWGGTSQFM